MATQSDHSESAKAQLNHVDTSSLVLEKIEFYDRATNMPIYANSRVSRTVIEPIAIALYRDGDKKYGKAVQLKTRMVQFPLKQSWWDRVLKRPQDYFVEERFDLEGATTALTDMRPSDPDTNSKQDKAQ